MTYFSLIEWVGVITALLYVYFATKGFRVCFVFGLISSAIFIYICFTDRLFFDTAINAYYVVMSVVGWIRWKSEDEAFHPDSIGWKQLITLLIISTVVAMVLGYIADNYTSASLSYVDAYTTVLAVVGTWMMVQKITENWLIWILADSISIFMYSYKDHYPMALLFAFYTVIAVYGYANWKKMMKMS